MTVIQKKIIGVLQGWCFTARLLAHGKLGLPAQTTQERELFKALFDLVAADGKLRVFEWGCGLSTTYYASFLEKKEIDFEWHALDSNRAWYEKVKRLVVSSKIDDRVKLYLQEFPPFWEKPGWGDVPPPCGVFAPKTEPELGYVDWPLRLGGAFDMIIVDARFRRRCLQTAKDAVKPNGLVILHDAQKQHYHEGLDVFPYRMFVNSGNWHPFQALPNRMWIGSLRDHSAFRLLNNAR
jgi:hypothetical protein